MAEANDDTTQKRSIERCIALQDADFEDCDLTGVELVECDIRGVNFKGCVIKNTLFKGMTDNSINFCNGFSQR